MIDLSGDAPGRMMAIDLGEKRIGIAFSDPYRMVAKAHGVIKRKSRKEDFARYNHLISEKKATLLVMGLPTYLDGSDSDQTRWVRHYTADLATHISIPIVFQDEAHTSQEAEETLRLRKQWRKKSNELDAIAAAHILHKYMELLLNGNNM